LFVDIGRFAQEDPIYLAGGDVNFYRYVHNSPTNRTDPQGLLDPVYEWKDSTQTGQPGKWKRGDENLELRVHWTPKHVGRVVETDRIVDRFAFLYPPGSHIAERTFRYYPPAGAWFEWIQGMAWPPDLSGFAQYPPESDEGFIRWKIEQLSKDRSLIPGLWIKPEELADFLSGMAAGMAQQWVGFGQACWAFGSWLFSQRSAQAFWETLHSARTFGSDFWEALTSGDLRRLERYDPTGQLNEYARMMTSAPARWQRAYLQEPTARGKGMMMASLGNEVLLTIVGGYALSLLKRARDTRQLVRMMEQGEAFRDVKNVNKLADDFYEAVSRNATDDELVKLLEREGVKLDPKVRAPGPPATVAPVKIPRGLTTEGLKNVNPNQSDLGKIALKHRVDHNVSTGRNVFVVEYEQGGVTRTKVFVSNTRLHSEEIALRELPNDAKVTRAYSDRTPCTHPSHECWPNLAADPRFTQMQEMQWFRVWGIDEEGTMQAIANAMAEFSRR
jgi:hypothetical protein